MCYIHFFYSRLSSNQCSEFLKLWMANQGIGEFPDLIEYYTTIGNGTILKEEYTTIENHT